LDFTRYLALAQVDTGSGAQAPVRQRWQAERGREARSSLPAAEHAGIVAMVKTTKMTGLTDLHRTIDGQAPVSKWGTWNLHISRKTELFLKHRTTGKTTGWRLLRRLIPSFFGLLRCGRVFLARLGRASLES